MRVIYRENLCTVKHAMRDAICGYSMKKLRAAYTGYCLKARRSTDNATQDIGFTEENIIDTDALISFCGSGDGFIDTWYDQKGNEIDAYQITSGDQPQIVSSGEIIDIDGDSFVQFDGLSDYLRTNTNVLLDIYGSMPYSQNLWIKLNGLPTQQITFLMTIGNGLTDTHDKAIAISNIGYAAAYVYAGNSTRYFDNTVYLLDDNKHMLTSTYKLGVLKLYIDGVLKREDLRSTSYNSLTPIINMGWKSAYNNDFYNGGILSAIMFNRALSECEIKALYDDGP